MHDDVEVEQTELGDAAAIFGYEWGCSAYHVLWRLHVAESLSIIVPESVKWQEHASTGDQALGKLPSEKVKERS